MYKRDQLFVDGQWSAPHSGITIDVISPHSQAVIGSVSFAGPEDVDRAVRTARTAFDDGPWPRMQPAERIAAITRLAELYKEHRGEMAELISAEIGCAHLIRQTRAGEHSADDVLRVRRPRRPL